MRKVGAGIWDVAVVGIKNSWFRQWSEPLEELGEAVPKSSILIIGG